MKRKRLFKVLKWVGIVYSVYILINIVKEYIRISKCDDTIEDDDDDNDGLGDAYE